MKWKKPLKQFFEENNCTEEEKKACYEYLMAIRLIPHIELLKTLAVKMRHIFK